MAVMMIADHHHVARYCKPSACEGDRISPKAFELREGESGLSVQWVERFEGERQGQVGRIRREMISTGYGLARNGRFAVLQVGAVRKNVVSDLRVEHCPAENNPSHAEILDWPDSQVERNRLAVLMMRLARKGEIFPARKEQ